MNAFMEEKLKKSKRYFIPCFRNKNIFDKETADCQMKNPCLKKLKALEVLPIAFS